MGGVEYEWGPMGPNGAQWGMGRCFDPSFVLRVIVGTDDPMPGTSEYPGGFAESATSGYPETLHDKTDVSP